MFLGNPIPKGQVIMLLLGKIHKLDQSCSSLENTVDKIVVNCKIVRFLDAIASLELTMYVCLSVCLSVALSLHMPIYHQNEVRS